MITLFVPFLGNAFGNMSDRDNQRAKTDIIKQQVSTGHPLTSFLVLYTHCWEI